MTPAEHYLEAQRLLNRATEHRGRYSDPDCADRHELLMAAQVHATLALARDPGKVAPFAG